jgi:hypothetical protein
MDVPIEIIRGVAGETVARNRRPLPFSIALMALGAIGERVHARQRKACAAMDLERLHVVPSSGRMATATSAAQPRLMRVAVTVFALSGHALLAAMTLIAGSGFVSSAEWKAGPGVIEASSHVALGHLPAAWSVAVPAIEPFGDRVVASGLGTRCLPIRILGHGNPGNGSKNAEAKSHGDRASHRPPFRRACGLA